MAKPDDIGNPELRGMVQGAFDAMRAGQGTDAVKALASTYLRFVEVYPEALTDTFPMRDRQVPKLMRWPALGANMKADSVAAGKPEIEFVRERFSVSEAMTYYQYVLDEILAKESG